MSIINKNSKWYKNKLAEKAVENMKGHSREDLIKLFMDGYEAGVQQIRDNERERDEWERSVGSEGWR